VSNAVKNTANQEPLFPPQAFLRPPVVMEFLFGLSPLAGIAFWGWDTYLVLILHLLALAIAAIILALRQLTLSNDALAYFIADNTAKQRVRALLTVRFGFTGFLLFVFLFPLALMTGMITEFHGGPWFKSLHGVGDFWRIVVVSSGLWIPLAGAAAWEFGSFLIDTILPRLAKSRLPARGLDMVAEPAALLPETRVFLYVRGMVVIRMLVTVIAIGTGMFVGDLLGAHSRPRPLSSSK
jgi:hypothetical protein